MATGDPKFINIRPGQLILQESSGFQVTDRGGFDVGERIYLTHPKTPRAQWPALGAADATYPLMRVAGGVRDRLLECTMLELTVPYRGLIDGAKPHKLTPGVSTTMFALPSAPNDTQRKRYVVPVPMPTCTRDYVSYTQPTYAGCGLPVVTDFLQSPNWSITFQPNPEEPQTLNFYSGWVLSSRTWEELGMGVWLVTELYSYYYQVAA